MSPPGGFYLLKKVKSLYISPSGEAAPDEADGSRPGLQSEEVKQTLPLPRP